MFKKDLLCGLVCMFGKFGNTFQWGFICLNGFSCFLLSTGQLSRPSDEGVNYLVFFLLILSTNSVCFYMQVKRGNLIKT